MFEELRESKQFKKIKRTAKLVGIGILIGLVLALIISLAWGQNKSEPNKQLLEVTQIDPVLGKAVEKDVTIEEVNRKLDGLGELSTAQMTYTGIYKVVEGSIPFITQKGFSMVYTARVKSGIDISELQVDVSDKKITIKIPDPEIQTIKIEPSSIQFYDEKHALFNKDEKNDVTEALQIAESDVKGKTDLADLLELTEERAELLVRNLLSDIIGDKELVIF